MSYILTVERLGKSFGRLAAVHDLSFEVDQGEILGIIGPNGAGKTTLFNLITGEIRPDSGKIMFNGTDVTFTQAYKRCRMGIARTYQIPRPFVNMTVLENVLVGAVYGGGMGRRASRERCEEVLKKTGLFSKRNAITESLPLLDRKRLELTKALATGPTVLLIDEVAGGLTELEVEEILQIIHSLKRDGITILWVEHIMMAMKRGPDRLLVMDFGEKLAYGNPDEVLDSEEVHKIYLGDDED
ncbi:MAG: ABC transporter ATP-binding protein [Thermodesulfobacteriota bacterium]